MGSQERGEGGGRRRARIASVAVGLAVGMVVLSLVGTGTAAATNVTEIDSCTSIDTSGTYVLNTSLTGLLTGSLVDSSSCIEITASDVVFDGGGHTVGGSNATGTIGINVTSAGGTPSNVTVANVTTTGWQYGVEYNGTTNGTVLAVNASENAETGINLTSAPGTAVWNVTANGNGDTSGHGVVVGPSSPNATVGNVTATGNGDDGIRLHPGANNATVWNGTARRNGARGIDVRAANASIEESLATANSGDGIRIDGANNTVGNTTVSRNQHGILVTDGSSNSSIVGNEVHNNTNEGIESAGTDTLILLNQADDNGGDGIRGGADNLVATNTANGNSGDGIQIGAGTVAIANVAEQNGNYGVHLNGADNATVQIALARNNTGSGVWVAGSDNAVIEGVVASDNTGTDAAGIYIQGGTNLSIQNVTLRNNVHGIDSGYQNARGVSLADARIGNSSGAAIDAGRVVNLTGRNVTFDEFTTDFEASHATLDPLDPANVPAPPNNTDDVGVLANVSVEFTEIEPAYLRFAPRYEDAAASAVDESSLRMWRYHSGWTEVGGSVDPETNRVAANITTTGRFRVAPLGRTLGNFTPTVESTSSPVTEGETLNVTATVENVGGSAGEETVTLEVDGAQVDQETVSLDSGANTTVTLEWETEAGDGGAHSVAVRTASASSATSVDVEMAQNDTGTDGGGGGGAPAQAEAAGESAAETVAQADEADSQESGDTSSVSVSGAVQAGQPSRFATQTSDTADNAVAVDDITLTAEQSTTVSLTVTQSTSPLQGSPSFTRPQGTDPRGYVNVQHDISNEQIQDASIEFRVRKDRLGPDEAPEDVALYRSQGGGWNELPTSQVGETQTHLVFEAQSPNGLSDFTVGVKQARFEITNALVSVSELSPGEGTQVQVRVTNTGGADGTFQVDLLLDGETVAERTLTVAANGTRRTVFDQQFDAPGEYQVAVNNVSVGTVTVQQAGAAGANGTGTGGGTAETTSTGFIPGFGPLPAILGVLLAGLYLHRRRT
jgi:PGF-pre-PGF domain-containing protein